MSREERKCHRLIRRLMKEDLSAVVPASAIAKMGISKTTS
jgi:hypothetical protein